MRVILKSQNVIRQRRPRWMRVCMNCCKPAMLMSSLLLLMLFCYIGLHGYLSQTHIFQLEKISLRGSLAELTLEEIQSLLNLPKIDSLFSISLSKARQDLKQHPWIKDVAVRRLLPDTLIVSIKEYEPVAFLYHDKKLHFVDKTGAVFKTFAGEERRDLPILTGIGKLDQRAVKKALQILKEIEAPLEEVGEEIAELHYDNIAGYSFLLVGQPVLVTLGKGNSFLKKMNRFYSVYRMAKIDKSQLTKIDLDYADRAFFKIVNRQKESVKQRGS